MYITNSDNYSTKQNDILRSEPLRNEMLIELYSVLYIIYVCKQFMYIFMFICMYVCMHIRKYVSM